MVGESDSRISLDTGAYDLSYTKTAVRPVAFALAMLAIVVPAAELTVVVDPSSSTLKEPTWRELKRELDEAFKDSKLKLDIQLRDRSKRLEATEIVVVRLKGVCRMDNFAPLMDEQGPLAWTHIVDGQILPFSDVACDHVRNAVAKAMWGGQRREKDRLLGRALARVIAHEIMHIVGKTHEHSENGIFREGLSGQQLVAARLTFDPQDIARLP
jgi:hypothetical protein